MDLTRRTFPAGAAACLAGARTTAALPFVSMDVSEQRALTARCASHQRDARESHEQRRS